MLVGVGAVVPGAEETYVRMEESWSFSPWILQGRDLTSSNTSDGQSPLPVELGVPSPSHPVALGPGLTLDPSHHF